MDYTKALKANVAHGITVVDPVDYPEAEWLQYADFRDSLGWLEEDEEVFMMADPTEYELIDEEWGIR